MEGVRLGFELTEGAKLSDGSCVILGAIDGVEVGCSEGMSDWEGDKLGKVRVGTGD